MPFGDDYIPVHRSSARRKACSCCIKAKRRCDLCLPACTRCRSKRLGCRYAISTSREIASPIAKCVQPRRIGNSSNSMTSWSSLAEPDVFSVTDQLLGDPMVAWNNTSSTLDSFPFPEFGAINARQMNYLESQFKSWITSFVLETQTPFIHAHSYEDELPIAYQDAMSICSLYRHQNSRNRATIFQMLDSKLSSLVQESNLWTRPQEMLLGLQSLLLYQIIRIFDGDVRQRGNAERNFALMDNWTSRLHENYFEASQRSSNDPYQNWILLESTRRTIMVSVLIRDLFSAMRDGICNLVPLISCLPVSNVGKSWDSIEQISWMGSLGAETLSTYDEFTQAWNSGAVVDVGDYEKMLLVACRRASGTSQFM